MNYSSRSLWFPRCYPRMTWVMIHDYVSSDQVTRVVFFVCVFHIVKEHLPMFEVLFNQEFKVWFKQRPRFLNRAVEKYQKESASLHFCYILSLSTSPNIGGAAGGGGSEPSVRRQGLSWQQALDDLIVQKSVPITSSYHPSMVKQNIKIIVKLSVKFP